MMISEVSKKYNISPDTLRYYEKIGLIPSVKRTEGGNRDYGESDLKWIEFIKCMRNAGMTVDNLVKYVRLFQQGDETIAARKEILQEQREQLLAKMAELQQTLDMLNYKIEIYDSDLLPIEQALI